MSYFLQIETNLLLLFQQARQISSFILEFWLEIQQVYFLKVFKV